MANLHSLTCSLDITIIVPVGGRNPDPSILESWFTGDLIQGIKFVFVLDNLEYSKKNAFKEIINKPKAQGVKIFEVRSMSPGGARNFGLQHVDTTWLSFCDSDDEPDLKSISEVLNSRKFDSMDIVRGRYKIKQQGNREDPKEIEESWETANHWELILSGPGIWRYLFKTELVRDKKFPELSLAEDQIFLMRAFWREPTIGQCDSNFYTYYPGNPDSLTSNRKKLGDLIQVFKIARMEFSKAKTAYQQNLALVVMARALITSRLAPKIFLRIVYDLITSLSFSNQIRLISLLKKQITLRILVKNEK